MASSFPGAIDSFTTKVDGVDDVMAAHVNDLQDSVVAIQTELGVDPAGSDSDVAARLDGIDAIQASLQENYCGQILLRSVVGAGGVSNFDVSSIPSGFEAIRILINGKTDESALTSGLVRIAFNNDTNMANYARVSRRDYTTTVLSNGSDSNIGEIGTTGNAIYTGQIEVNIIDPDSSFQKDCQALGTNMRASVQNHWTHAVHWYNTAKINRITIFPQGAGAKFAEGTKCVIIGYKTNA